MLIIDHLGTGGTQRQIVNMGYGLCQQGHIVDIACYYPGNYFSSILQNSSINIYFLSKQSRYSLGIVKQLKMLIQKKKYDIVFSALNTPNFYNLAANFFTSKPKIILSERSHDLKGYLPPLPSILRYLYVRANLIILNSFSQLHVFKKKYPWLKERIRVIYNGYDLQYFRPPDRITHNNPIKILTVSSISRTKNGLCLVEALRILRDKFSYLPTVNWIGEKVMVGDRYKYYCEMESKIFEYNLNGQWNWLGQRTDMVDQYHNHDVVIHPSYLEGLPNVVCEALSCGKPIIVSNTLDHPILVQNNESGLLFDWQNPEDLAMKIITFSRLPLSERERFGRNGRKYAEANLTLNKMISDLESLFLNLLC